MSASGPVGLLLASQLLGAAALAVWVEVRLRAKRKQEQKTQEKRRGRMLAFHVGVAFVVLAVGPHLLPPLAKALPPAWTALGVFGLFLPALVYAFLASLWSLTYLRDTLFARGG